MKLLILCMGCSTDKTMRSITDRYMTRLSHYLPAEYREIPDVKISRSTTEEKQKELEGKEILASLQPGDRLVLLDERGKQMTSREFAGYIDEAMVRVPGKLILVVGGPYGFSQQVYDRADGKISLSKMTMTHEMVRMFIAEQVYRAMTILRGEPYHHD